jgi:uncharacterized protein with HEPN domain
MPAPTLRDRLQHIVDAIDRIDAMWAGKAYQDYRADELRRLATDRLLEIISEASRHVPDQDKAAHPETPWQQIRRFGNIMRHFYDRVDHQEVWEIITLDLPALRVVIASIIAKHERPGL